MADFQKDHLFYFLIGLSCCNAAQLGCEQSHETPRAAHCEFRTAVAGRVTLDGKPINHCRVRFDSTIDGQTASAIASVVNGQFWIPAEVGPFPGRNSFSIEPELVEDVEAINLIQSDADRAVRSLERQPLPTKYQVQGALLVEVEPASEQPLSIELTSN